MKRTKPVLTAAQRRYEKARDAYRDTPLGAANEAEARREFYAAVDAVTAERRARDGVELQPINEEK